MTTAAAGIHPGGPLHESLSNLLAMMTMEEMHWLLSDPQAWEKVTEALGLDRDEEDTLKCILEQELEWCEGTRPSGNLSQEERMFVLVFPLQRYKLEETIRELYTIADQVDKTHRVVTNTNLVASSSDAVASVMTILGMALAPVTAGQGLLLLAAGQGLGAAAVATNMLTNVLENRHNAAARDRASRLGAPLRTTLEAEAGGGTGFPTIEAAKSCAGRCAELVTSIRQLRACQAARANPGFLGRLRSVVATSRVPFWRPSGVQRTVGAPAVAVTRSARLLGVAGAGVALLQDLRSIRQSWAHLEEGARTETAEELRVRARELEQELSRLCQRYEVALQRQ